MDYGSFAGFEVPIQMDISAEKIFGVAGIDPQRRAELIKVLDVDISWRLHKVSDGQRRRVQICMGLLKPFKECQERGATIIYATHIFDGLENWPTHIVYVADGKLQLAMPMEKVKETSKKLVEERKRRSRRGRQGKKGKPMAFLNSNHMLKKAVSPVTLLGCSTMAGLPADFTLPLQAVKIISYLAQTEFSDKHWRDSKRAKGS